MWEEVSLAGAKDEADCLHLRGEINAQQSCAD
jgi:hypothetical protein